MREIGRRNFLKIAVVGVAAAVGATVLLAESPGSCLVVTDFGPVDLRLPVELETFSYNTLSIVSSSTVTLGRWVVSVPVLLGSEVREDA